MTTHYLDIAVIPDPEISVPQLMGALYEKLHLALAQGQINNIGASFPGYSTIPKTLGHLLRLHSTETALQNLQATDWLKGMRDHVRITSITEVPHHALHRVVRRKQFKTNVDRLRRRRIRKTGETEQYVKEKIPKSVEQIPTLPYIQMRSRSTGQSFYLYIAMESTQSQPISGTFTSYGLSTHATIPWF